jgi:hypothetical protein
LVANKTFTAGPPDLSSKENPARRPPLPGFQGLSRQQG